MFILDLIPVGNIKKFLFLACKFNETNPYLPIWHISEYEKNIKRVIRVERKQLENLNKKKKGFFAADIGAICNKIRSQFLI